MLKDIITKTNIEKEKAERQAEQRAEQQAFVNKLLAERQGNGKQ